MGKARGRLSRGSFAKRPGKAKKEQPRDEHDSNASTAEKRRQGEHHNNNDTESIIVVEEKHDDAEQSPQSPTEQEHEPQDDDIELVFQCVSCNVVIGDTQSEYQTHLSSGTLCLKAASNITIQPEILASKKGVDAGCTFRKVACSNCNVILGRVYSATSAAIDSRRSFFNFFNSELTSYELGSSRTVDGKLVPVERKVNANAAFATNSAAHGASSEDYERLHRHVYTLTEAVSELRGNLTHVENMLLLWEERFGQLENCERNLSRYDLCEKKVKKIEEFLRQFGTTIEVESPNEHRVVTHSQQQSLKPLPAIRKNLRSPLNRRGR